MRTLICESLGAFIVALFKKMFLVGEKLFISLILWNPFLVGIFLIRVKCGTQDIPLHTYACEPRNRHVGSVSFILSTNPSMKRHSSRL